MIAAAPGSGRMEGIAAVRMGLHRALADVQRLGGAMFEASDGFRYAGEKWADPKCRSISLLELLYSDLAAAADLLPSSCAIRASRRCASARTAASS